MDTQQALLRAILLNPDDDTARLVYADWLEEYGNDAARAEFVRCSVRMSQLGSPTTENVMEFSRCLEVVQAYDQNEKLRAQEAESGLPYLTLFRDNRGFVGKAILTLAVFHEHAKALFSLHPITAVTLADRFPHTFINSNRGHGFSWLISANLTNRCDTLPRALYGHLPMVGTRNKRNPLTARLDPTVQDALDALDALSRACVAYGRSLAGLPPLPGTGAGSPE